MPNFAKGDRETCFNRCSEAGYAYAGLQYTGECHCGNEYGKHGETTGCNCERGSRQFGVWKQCIYQLDESAPTPAPPAEPAPTPAPEQPAPAPTPAPEQPAPAPTPPADT